ncbi:MAG: hypothetical protein IJ072_04255 [Oscillospiraceae bacterium]|nr:hypothetical protein [Oscillospiraceae bacterium]
MELKYTKDLTILPSICDSEARLGLTDTFNVFMDIATCHAQALGVGAAPMFRRGLFWLTAKTKIHFYERPAMMEDVTVSTWAVEPEELRCLREYTVHRGEKLLISGKTQWAVMNTATGKLHPMSDVFPGEVNFASKPEFDAPFARVDYSRLIKELGRYTVRSTDIDLGGHMNNVAYIRAVLGMFSTKQLRQMKISDMDVSFVSSCYEGDELSIRMGETDTGCEIGAFLPNGKAVLLAEMS